MSTSVSNEAHLISSVLRERQVAPVMAAELKPSMFEKYEVEWKWLTAYMEKHRTVPSKAAFQAEFPEFKVTRVEDTAYYAGEVRKHFALMQVQEQLVEVGELIADGHVYEALASMQKSIFDTSSIMGSVPDSDGLRDHADIKQDVLDYHDRIVDTGFPGVPTGFKTWDMNTGGSKPGEFVVVGARLGNGKSWVMNKMASEAVMAGYTVLYDALEMTRTNVMLRMQTLLATATGRPYEASKLMTGTKVPDLTGYDEILAHLEDKVPGAFHIADSTRGQISLATVAAQIERIQPDIVFIDYLTLMDMTGEWQSVAALSNQVKQLAQRYKIPIVAAAQLNRAAGVGVKGIPGNEALARSDSIGQDADQVMNISLRSARVLQHKLVKNRNGAGGMKWWTEFRPGAGVIEEIDSERAIELMDEDGDLDDE